MGAFTQFSSKTLGNMMIQYTTNWECSMSFKVGYLTASAIEMRKPNVLEHTY